MLFKRIGLLFRKPLVSYLVDDSDVYEIWKTDSNNFRKADDGLTLVIRSDIRGSGIIFYRFSNEPFDGASHMDYVSNVNGGAVYVHKKFGTKVLLDKKYKRMFGYYPSTIYLKRKYE